MIGIFNIASLVLGLVAWIIPLIAMAKPKTLAKHWVFLCWLSLSACVSSLFFQLWGYLERVKAADWSALLDTASAITMAAAILLIVTVVLNAIVLSFYRSE